MQVEARAVRAAPVTAAQLERSRCRRDPHARARACRPTSLTRAPGRAKDRAPVQYTANMSRLVSVTSVPASQCREVMEVQDRRTSSRVWRGMEARGDVAPGLGQAGPEAEEGVDVEDAR